jgi:RimJ/RimL family protein N-acetyltransferase
MMESEITLRIWKMDDLESLVRYAGNKAIWDNLTDAFPHPYTKEAGLNYIGKASKDVPARIFAIEFQNEVVGSIGIFPDTDVYRKNAAIAYWVAEPFWGKGIATEAIRKMVKYAFATFDIARIYARPFGKNVASHKVLEKAGFCLEGILIETVLKNDVFLDEFIYAIRRQKAGASIDT